MKNLRILILCCFLIRPGFSQVGIGTVSPNSTLDVRGSFASSYRSFTSNISATSTDYTLVFTGTSATALTIPDATTCTGRIYWIKNASTTLPVPVLTINTTSSQTIDGLTSWLLDETYESVIIVSNGANWQVISEGVPANNGSAWLQGGNSVTATRNLGTISNFDLPFITNNTEKMRLTAAGLLGVGISSPTSTLQSGGSVAMPIVAKTTTYTAAANDYTIVCNPGGINSMTVNLPAASGCTGRVYVIKRISGLTVTIDGNASETIDGSLTQTILLNSTLMIQSDGSNWLVLAKN